MSEAFYRNVVDVDALPPTVQVKWNRELLREGFVPVPKRLLRSLQKLFGNAPEIEELATILAIVDFKRPQGPAKASEEYLAFLAGLPVDRLRGALRRLQDKGWATVGDPDKKGRIEINLGKLNRAVLASIVE